VTNSWVIAGDNAKNLYENVLTDVNAVPAADGQSMYKTGEFGMECHKYTIVLYTGGHYGCWVEIRVNNMGEGGFSKTQNKSPQ